MPGLSLPGQTACCHRRAWRGLFKGTTLPAVCRKCFSTHEVSAGREGDNWLPPMYGFFLKSFLYFTFYQRQWRAVWEQLAQGTRYLSVIFEKKSLTQRHSALSVGGRAPRFSVSWPRGACRSGLASAKLIAPTWENSFLGQFRAPCASGQNVSDSSLTSVPRTGFSQLSSVQVSQVGE